MTKTNTTIMQRLGAFTEGDAPQVSFEFFPPKTEAAEKSLWNTIKQLEPYAPKYISVTYGAGGSTQQKTFETVVRIKKETTLTPVAHLTCVGASKADISTLVQDYLANGITHILALRGDAPANQPDFKPHPDGYEYATDLIQGLKAEGDLTISAAAFPEKHPEANSLDEDIANLKRKQDAGATSAITQYFFDPEDYLSFAQKARAAGVTIPLVAGILLMNGIEQMIRFSNMSGASVPQWALDLLDGLDDTPEQRDMVSCLLAAEQVRILREAGVNEFHFYTLNRPHIAAVLCRLLGINKQA